MIRSRTYENRPIHHAIHLGATSFDQSSITIPVSSRLIFADDAGIPHILTYGSWDASNRAHNATQPAGAPALNNLRINSGTIEVGPFTAAGTYHIYCLVHPGMNLTVIVQ
ncbi:MAG TPA: plastocyanin/azurin family copper-binding protein [Ktedonobacterales bacterium]|nr:plastocyanin/azurin family copper-binding protein [Ktedonobacterales bacterium]